MDGPLATPEKTIEKKQVERKDTLQQLEESAVALNSLRDRTQTGLQTDIIDKLDELQQRIELLEERIH